VSLRALAAGLDAALAARGEELAVHLVFDRPERERERPGLSRLAFAQRCASDEEIETLSVAYRDIGAYVEVFQGEHGLVEALGSGRLAALGRPLQAVYNGIGWGVGSDGFMVGRKALVPLLADSYGLTCVNADAYACAFTLHKFHSFLVLAAMGVRVPPTWQFRADYGWLGPRPAAGTRVIAKSTFEASSVGVTADSVFEVGDDLAERLTALERELGQPVIVQQFIPGHEICVPVLVGPRAYVAPPMRAVLQRAPDDVDAFMTIGDTTTPNAYTHRVYDGPERLMHELRETASDVARMLVLRGLCRMDFRVDAEGRPWLFDVAIEPGISARSSAFRSFAHLGLDHGEFLRAVLATSLWDDARLEPLVPPLHLGKPEAAPELVPEGTEPRAVQ
jgi:D-alanine-D-alanine ligase